MYYPSHGPDICGSRAFPTRCQSCRLSVFYFFCEHGSKVFFDDLGPPWPEHHCGSSRSQSPPRRPLSPPGREALANMRGITFGVQSRDHGLMLGMRRASVRMPGSAIRRFKEARSRSRETFRMDPLGSRRETLIGKVTAINTVNLVPFQSEYGG